MRPRNNSVRRMKKRSVGSKIFIYSHAEVAEPVYLNSLKDHVRSRLMLKVRYINAWSPQELIEKVLALKETNTGINGHEEDSGDQVWCVFDIDSFCDDPAEKIRLEVLIKRAHESGIKIAYTNQCFELWYLMHFITPVAPISRGSHLNGMIARHFKKNKLGDYEKNMAAFGTLAPGLDNAVLNATKVSADTYDNINWAKVLSNSGNPSTSLHFLIKEIIKSGSM